jgi:hypothetical protein
MASVYRADTNAFLGYVVELHGPLLPGTQDWPFRALEHPDGSFRHEPPPPTGVGRLRAPPPVELRIPVRNIDQPDVHLVVPPALLDFITHHGAFRAAPAKAG